MNIVISGNINKICVRFLIQKKVYIANLIAHKGCFLHLKMLKSKNLQRPPYPCWEKETLATLAFYAALKLIRPPSFFDFGTALVKMLDANNILRNLIILTNKHVVGW